MSKVTKKITLFSALLIAVFIMGTCINSTQSKAANPYLPMWEHIPDGEPYVFEDPDNPGKFRLYVYGSHDTFLTKYCGDNLVVWSAPVENLNDWRYDGEIFSHNGDTLYAPDIAVKEENGEKVYYLYPNDQNKQGIIAKSDSPIGPFEVCNENGVLGFDPAVFVDDDGRVYGYWGFNESNMAELDPDTMCTVKDGCKVLKKADTNVDGSNEKVEPYFRFFEASSVRKITDNGKTLYAFIYSRKTMNNDFGLGECNATLAYAYSENPLGPWTYGGTLVDARAREKDENGKTIETFQWGNTHGSIVDVNDQWYLFYHRCINNDQYSRQGTVEAVNVKITDDGKLEINEAEVTSQGFEINGLNPYESHSAGIMCYRIGSSYVKATYDHEENSSPVLSNKNGNIVGYKYFNFQKEDWQWTTFDMDIIGKGTKGTIKLMLDSPWESCGGKEIGQIEITGNESKTDKTTKSIITPAVDDVTGKHALYFVFKASGSSEIADICDFKFVLDGIAPPSTATPEPTSSVPTSTPPVTTPAVNTTPLPTPAVTSSAAPLDNKSELVKGAKFKIGKIRYIITYADLTGKGTVAVYGRTSGTLTSITVPGTVKISGVTFKVTGIRTNAFKGLKKLSKVVIGKNVKSIGEAAFLKCPKLRRITITSLNLTKVGASSLKSVHPLCKIKVPKSKYAAYKELYKGKGQTKLVKIIM